ncbi:hypothetical protein A2W14_07195 [Candidatus Gottesmanbacteria bacterium RBG_16_37_8]|uniref:VOC domain-containing protein n=1 Tax=Candidatus Gottesmanbacteria bacterium RBG_16_37_8 TaxID=1798371 RepID=A0A1F5YNI0_9BACT|nr:MAG: hypothetical protein A2W14_07195 [Candidatus Gottesmanbacteria bacterium RBG_16_37_8]
MFRGIDSILLYSENPDRLAEFYEEKVGLKVGLMGEYGDDFKEKVYEVKAGDSKQLAILHHSKIKGKNKQPERYMVNFEVKDIEKMVEKLVKNKVKLVRKLYHVEDYGKIATFEDIDGNYFQLVQVRA